MFFKKNIFLLFFLVFSFNFLFAQDYVLNYEHLTSQTGLANNFVNCMLQEKEGFVWIGTQDGLCRYDGNNYKVYRTNEDKQVFLNSINITCLAQENDSIIWVGTAAGLHRLNTFQKKVSSLVDFENDIIEDIFIDSNQTTWVIASKKNIYTKAKNDTNWINFTSKNRELQGKDWVKITEQKIGKDNQILLIEEQTTGVTKTSILYLFDKDEKKWKKSYYNAYTNIDFIDNSDYKNPKLIVSKNRKTNIDTLDISYNDNSFVIQEVKIKQTESRNVIKNLSAQRYQEYVYVPLYRTVLIVDAQSYQTVGEINLKDFLTVDNAIIKDFFIDNLGNIWIGTFGEGIFIFPIYGLRKIRAYTVNPNNPTKGISNSSVRTIYKDYKTKNTWIGTYSNKQQIDIFIKDSIKKELPIQSQAYIIREDKKDNSILWVATYNGLLKIDKEEISIKNRFLAKERVRALLQLDDSILLFANEDSMYILDSQKDEVVFRNNFSKNTSFYMSDDKTVWLGTENEGIFVLEIKNNTIQKIKNYNPHENEKITNCHVKSIFEDSKGKFWIATTRGLYLFDRKKETFIASYTEKEGLANNVVYGILEDENYHLWMSTNKGISDFDIKNETFENFTVQDGLQEDEFNSKSFLKSEDGELFFGGIKGLNAFYPKNMKRNTYIPPIVLTGFKKFGKEVELDIPIEKLQKLSLPQDEAQMITFEVAALNFYQNNRNEYAYRIEELGKDWVYLGTNNEVTLTNLAAGNYTLHIKASNNHGVWNEEGLKVELSIIPPFWMQTWFIVSCIVTFLILVYSIYKFRVYAIRQREFLLETQIKERTKELAESNRSKDQLFAIIAHDLRSPITAFQGVSKQINFFLRKNQPERLEQISSSIDSSAQNLNHLLNNLLNWSLTETKQISMDKKEISLFQNVEEVIKIYQLTATENKIELENQVSKSTIVFVDKDSFQTIIRNLVGNAIKYTPENGKISISAEKMDDTEKDESKILLKVTDTGIGINDNFKEKLFQLSVAHSSRGIRGEKGTGLGLVLCYQFAELNNIKIEVESKENEGTTFSLWIPVGELGD